MNPLKIFAVPLSNCTCTYIWMLEMGSDRITLHLIIGVEGGNTRTETLGKLAIFMLVEYVFSERVSGGLVWLGLFGV